MRFLAIILTFVGLSVAATGLLASAATIGLTGVSLGANTDSVASCDSAVNVAWDTEYSAAMSGYRVSSVTISNILAACEDATLEITLAEADGDSLASPTPITVGATGTETFTIGGTVSAELLANVAVLLTGP